MRRSVFAAACTAAIALVIAVFANSLDNSFHFDDSHVIENNAFIRNLANAPKYFTDAHTFSSIPQNATYRPLVTLTLAIDYARGGLDPRPYHVSQITLMIITGAMLVAFFHVLTKSPWISLFAATLFCVHTANTETMNLISARSELLSTVGLLGSFLLFVYSQFARRTLLYLVPLAIGALAKAPLVVFAPLLFAYLILFEKQTAKRAFVTALPSLVLGVGLLVFLNAMNAPEWIGGGGSALHYAWTQPFVWLHYFRLFFLPAGLTADPDWQPFTRWYDTRAIAGYAFVALLVLAIAKCWRRDETKAIAFGLTWFAIALVPTSSFFPLAEVANEHRVFFAYIGLVVAFGVALGLAATRVPRQAVVGSAIAVIALNAYGAHVRNRTWRTEETLWADVVRKSPANGRAWMNYGLTQMQKGNYAGAKGMFERAATFTPDYGILEINRGIVEGALGDDRVAESHFRRALELDRGASAHFYYGRWLVKSGRGKEALPELERALQISPSFIDARVLLLKLYLATGRDAQFAALAAETRRIDPSALGEAGREWPSYDAAFKEGFAAIGRKDWIAAAVATRAALRHDPRSSDAWNNLGWALAKIGFPEDATHAYEQALAIDPSFERAANNLRLLRQAQPPQ